MKRILIIIGIVALIGLGCYVFFYKIPANEADQAITSYIKKENVHNVKVKKERLEKNWTLGGFYTIVEFADDKNYSYQYFYKKDSGWNDDIRVEVGKLDKGKEPRYHYDDNKQ